MIELSKVTLTNKYKQVVFSDIKIEKLVILENGLTVIRAGKKQGKTSLVNFLSGKKSNITGNVYLGKYELKGRTIPRTLRKLSVVLGDEESIIKDKSIFENILSTITNTEKKTLQLIDEVAKLLQIENLQKIVTDDKLTIFKTLLLRSLIENPNLLLIDNIDEFVTEENASFIISLLKIIKQKTSILVTGLQTSKFESFADVTAVIKDSNLSLTKNDKNYENNFNIKSIYRSKANSLLSVARYNLKPSNALRISLLFISILLSIFLGMTLFTNSSLNIVQQNSVYYETNLVITKAQYYKANENDTLLKISPDPRREQNKLFYFSDNNKIEITPPQFVFLSNLINNLVIKQGRKPAPSESHIELIISSSFAGKLQQVLPKVYNSTDLINKELITSNGVKYKIVGISQSQYDSAYLNEAHISSTFLKPGYDFLANTDKVEFNTFHLNLSQNLINHLKLNIGTFPYTLSAAEKTLLKDELITNSFVEFEKLEVIIDKPLESDNKVEFSLSYFVLYITNNKMFFNKDDSFVISKDAISEIKHPYIKVPKLRLYNLETNKVLDTTMFITSILLLVSYVVLDILSVLLKIKKSVHLRQELSHSEKTNNLFTKSLYLSSFLSVLITFLPGLIVGATSFLLAGKLINAYLIGIGFVLIVLVLVLFILLRFLINFSFTVKRAE